MLKSCAYFDTLCTLSTAADAETLLRWLINKRGHADVKYTELSLHIKINKISVQG